MSSRGATIKHVHFQLRNYNSISSECLINSKYYFTKIYSLKYFFDFPNTYNRSLLWSFAYHDDWFLQTGHRSAVLNLKWDYYPDLNVFNLRFYTSIHKLPSSNLRLQTLILTFAKIKFWKTNKTILQVHCGNTGNILP